jgi:L-amino acid N-acyltransferase YncA
MNRPAGEVTLQDLVVAPAHRRREIGTRLLQRVMTKLGRGYDRLLAVVAADNLAAQSFLRSAGFAARGADPDTDGMRTFIATGVTVLYQPASVTRRLSRHSTPRLRGHRSPARTASRRSVGRTRR